LDRLIQTEHEGVRELFDRRALLRATGGGLAAALVLGASPLVVDDSAEAFVPNNFRACIHVTREDDFQFAFAALQTIADQYKKASGRLIVDGAAVKALTSEDMISSLKSANDKGASIQAASDALAINGIDPSSLPGFIDAKNTGVIAVVDSQVKGYHYYKL
jgi:intracellular sulfur oxidation DsrE/DsrF family protein